MSETEFQEQLMSYFETLTKSRLVEIYGLWKGRNYANEFVDTFRGIFSKNEHLMPDTISKRHGVNPAFVLALHDILQQESVSFDELKEHILAIYGVMMQQLVDNYKANLEASEDSWKSIVEYTKAGNQQNYDNRYFNLDYITDNDNELGFDIKKCLYFEIFKANGHPELGTILCEYDYILMDATSKWVRFRRTETIADGNVRCDFRLYRR
jgi:hypothetical protein